MDQQVIFLFIGIGLFFLLGELWYRSALSKVNQALKDNLKTWGPVRMAYEGNKRRKGRLNANTQFIPAGEKSLEEIALMMAAGDEPEVEEPAIIDAEVVSIETVKDPWEGFPEDYRLTNDQLDKINTRPEVPHPKYYIHYQDYKLAMELQGLKPLRISLWWQAIQNIKLELNARSTN